MPTNCNSDLFGFAPVEGRAVVACFDGGAITSDAGGLLLGSADRAIGLVDRFASCFRDARSSALIEHAVSTLVGQRIFGIALAMRTRSTTMSCATTRSWWCWSESSRRGGRTGRRLPANRRLSTVSSRGTPTTPMRIRTKRQGRTRRSSKAVDGTDSPIEQKPSARQAT